MASANVCDRGKRLPQVSDEAVLSGVVRGDPVPADRHRYRSGDPGQQCRFSRTSRGNNNIEAVGYVRHQWLLEPLARQPSRLRRAELLLKDGV